MNWTLELVVVPVSDVDRAKSFYVDRVGFKLEIDRKLPGGRLEVEGRYSDFLVRRDETLASQAAYQDALANRVRREVAWLRRGAGFVGSDGAIGRHHHGRERRCSDAENFCDVG